MWRVGLVLLVLGEIVEWAWSVDDPDDPGAWVAYVPAGLGVIMVCLAAIDWLVEKIRGRR